MTSTSQKAVRPGEIKISLIPIDWPLTPLGPNKDPYTHGWQLKPFTITEIEDELASGQCKAIGLLGGPFYNHPYGLCWVDVDGPSVFDLIEKTAELPYAQALPPTLTICSGKVGRERRLYKVSRDHQKHFIRNKYTWHSETNKEKLEILWSKHQGVLMGMHPETEGYFTKDGLGFEWVHNLPELPEWILSGIITKNARQGKPSVETSRVIGPGFVIEAEMGLERDIQLAKEATWGMPPEAADDYDIWLTVGQTLHSLDESLLDEWDEWSKQSLKYKEGVCHNRWLGFNKQGGRGVGSLIFMAKEQGWSPSQEHRAMSVDDSTLEHIAKQLAEMQSTFEYTQQQQVEDQLITVVPMSNKEEKKKRTRRTKEGDGDKPPRNRAANEVADNIMALYGEHLKYSEQHGCFYLYEYRSKGVWCSLSDNEMKGSVKDKIEHVKGELLPNGYSMSMITDVVEQLRISLLDDDWYEGSDYLLFTNGILDVQTRELLPFNWKLHMTQQLPYEYDPGADCEQIIKWLKVVQANDWGRVQVLRAWLRAVLLSHSEIQKFVEVVGPGKSGKSTYANLAHALVGQDNAMTSSLEHIEKSRFETANLYKKKLVLFNDVERYGGSVAMLKGLTGGDLIRKELKFKSGSQNPFKFSGLVMITANEPIQTTDPTSGLARRRLTIPFDKPFKGTSAEQRILIDMNDKGKPYGDFASLLPGLVNWLLDMSEVEMREYLMETTTKVPFFAKHNKEQILKSNSLLDWMEHCVVFDVDAVCQIGQKKLAPRETSTVYVNAGSHLYPNYCEFSTGSGNNIMSRSRFENNFLDACKHQLGLNVYKFKRGNIWLFGNVACRAESSQKHSDYPSIIEVGLNKAKWLEYYGETLIKETDETIEIGEEQTWDTVSI